MNKRRVAILQRFLQNSNWHVSELSKDFSISPRMVRHELQSVNVYLEDADLPIIIANRRSGFVWPADDKQKCMLADLLASLDSYDYSLSSEERQKAMALYMLASDHYMTSTNFASMLGVSKSCIDKDLGMLRESLAGIGISLESCSGKGSRICGDERLVRNFCHKEISKYVSIYVFTQNDAQLDSYVGRCAKKLYCDDYLRPLFEILRSLESDKIGKQLSDESLNCVLLYLAITLVRVKNGNVMCGAATGAPVSESLKEYGFAEKIAEDIRRRLRIVLPDEELSYIAQLLRGVQYVETEPYDREDWAEIQLLSGRLIKEMSLRTGVDFVYDTQLHQALQIHLGRTVFNLRHGIATINPTLSDVRTEFSDYFRTMKESIRQIDTKSLKGITDDDKLLEQTDAEKLASIKDAEKLREYLGVLLRTKP